MDVLALRHGQSELNLLGLCNDDPARAVGLTGLGRAQARQAGRELAARSVDRILCSQLPRAVQIARLINESLRVPLQEAPELNDIRTGFDGRPVAEYEYLAAISADPWLAAVDDGESLLAHKTPVEIFLRKLAQRPFGCVALVAHEETLRVFMAWHEGLSPEQVLGLSFGNCEVHPFEL